MSDYILITSALPYVNNTPHLGNIVGSVLSGDVASRYLKKRNPDKKVIYLCGTDEYGTTTEIKAYNEKLSCQEICDKYHKVHKDIYDWFNINFDVWGRTSTEQHTYITQNIMNSLYNNNFIEEQETEQFYDSKLGFIADRYISGTCYIEDCKDECTGDQCDKCGRIMELSKIINPICNITKQTPVLKKTKNLYLKLSKFKSELQNFFNLNSSNWSDTAKLITLDWLKKDLYSTCITRDLKWGVPVPQKYTEFKDKVFYVWFDAPIGYLSILASKYPNWRSIVSECHWVQFMAKDNVRFHSVMFPSTLFGTKEKFTKNIDICATEYLNFEGNKFSKSKGIGIFGDQVKELSQKLNITEDYWRFYLMKIRPETKDSDFSIQDFIESINTSLVNNISNLVHRTLSLTYKYFGEFELNEEIDKYIETNINMYGEKYFKSMDKFNLREGLQIILKLSSIGNIYLEKTSVWSLYKKNKNDPKIRFALQNTLRLIFKLLDMLEPYIPNGIYKIRQNYDLKDNVFSMIQKPKIVFKRLDDENIKKFESFISHKK
ncbi:MAG: methionine--tRNA ligase [Magnetococcales bacterium]|nr:methionine--tRNA ligase [Magnetococcales bacterium]|tara:strand:+ start:38930 stop:40567 length:1638 start_codon:yes stop_codon:yes gene_type:complete